MTEWEKAVNRALVGVNRKINFNMDYIDEYDMETIKTALEKQIPKKPIMMPYYEDIEEEYLCCPTCGEILTDRIPMDNKDFYFHCLNCGQKLDWN